MLEGNIENVGLDAVWEQPIL